jgi:hypothetical protein
MAWGVPKIGALATPVTSGNLTLAEPAGIATGDLMVACIAYRSTAAFTVPGDWNLVATQQSSGDTDATNGIASGLMMWCVRGGSAPTLTFNRTGGDMATGRIIAYTGAKASPFDTGSANTLGSASATVTTGTITTAEPGELIVAMVSCGDNLATSAFDAATDPTTASGATDTTTAPTNGTWIERADDGTNTGADGALAIADAIRATAGATGTIQATVAARARHVMIAAAFKVDGSATASPGVGLLVATGFAPTVTSTSAITIDFVCGAECGIVGIGTTPVPSTRHWDSANGDAPTIVAGRTGGSALQWALSGTSGRLGRTVTGTERTFRGYLYFDTLPTGISNLPLVMFISTGGSCSLLYRQADSTIIAAVGTTTTGATAVSVTTGVWYRIDMTGNSASGTRTCSLTVDGVDKGTASASVATAPFTMLRVGGSCNGDLVTGTVLWDDMIASTLNAEYPLGEGQIVGLLPNVDGTHSFSASTDFEYNDTTGIATNATDVHTYLDHQMTTISDFIAITGAASGEYVEIGFEPLPAAASVNALAVVSAHHAAGTTANKTTLRVVDGAVTNDACTDSDFSATTLHYNEKVYPSGIASGVGAPWTSSAIDALLVRITSSFGTADIDSVPYVDAVMLEVDYIPDGGITATPALGQLIATGFAPTAQTPVTVTPALGVLLVTGFAPTVTATAHVTVTPAPGELTATGLAPTASTTANVTVTPALGQLTATGFVPTVSATAHVTVTPALGALTATGFAPTVQTPVTVTPALGQLTATGFAPTISLSVQANTATGALTATGFSPTVSATAHVTVTPGVGLLVATGLVPTAEGGAGVTVTPALGQLTATGFAPTVTATNHQTVTPGTGQAALVGLAPTAQTPVTAATGLGALTAAGFAPTVTVSVQASTATGTATLTGFAPTVLAPRTVTPGLGTLTATGHAPTVLAPVTVVSATGELDATGFAPVVTATTGTFARPGVGVLEVVGYAPLIDTGQVEIEVGTGLLVFKGFRPQVTATAEGAINLRRVSPADAVDLMLGEGFRRRRPRR